MAADYHQFSVEYAKEFGVNEAIVINCFRHWLELNHAHERNQREGHTWTYNSYKAMEKLMPYWTSRTIRYAIDSLVKKGVLLKKQHRLRPNKALEIDGGDARNWFAFADEERFLGGKQAGQVTKVTDGGQVPNLSDHLPNSAPLSKEVQLRTQVKNGKAGTAKPVVDETDPHFNEYIPETKPEEQPACLPESLPGGYYEKAKRLIAPIITKRTDLFGICPSPKLQAEFMENMARFLEHAPQIDFTDPKLWDEAEADARAYFKAKTGSVTFASITSGFEKLLRKRAETEGAAKEADATSQAAQRVQRVLSPEDVKLREIIARETAERKAKAAAGRAARRGDG